MPHLTDRRAIITSGAALAAGALVGGAAQRLMFPFIKDRFFARDGENIILYVAAARSGKGGMTKQLESQLKALGYLN